MLDKNSKKCSNFWICITQRMTAWPHRNGLAFQYHVFTQHSTVYIFLSLRERFPGLRRLRQLPLVKGTSNAPRKLYNAYCNTHPLLRSQSLEPKLWRGSVCTASNTSAGFACRRNIVALVLCNPQRELQRTSRYEDK